MERWGKEKELTVILLQKKKKKKKIVLPALANNYLANFEFIVYHYH